MPLGLFLAAVLLGDGIDPPAFTRFQRSKSLIYITETVTVAMARPDPANRGVLYEVHYEWRQYPDKVRSVSFDSKSCPRIVDVLAGMKDIEMPKPAPYGIGETPMMVVDGTTYMLQAPSSYSNGQLEISSNVGSPLAKWIDSALDALDGCIGDGDGSRNSP